MKYTVLRNDGSSIEVDAEAFDADREVPEPALWSSLRNKRDMLLKETDWTQLPDSSADQEAWAMYRQELRDLPQNAADPSNPIWPTPPGAR